MGIYIYMQWGYAGGFVGCRPTILLYCQSINAQVMAIKWKIKCMGLNWDTLDKSMSAWLAASNKARLETDEKNAMIKLIPSNDL